jgi:predicted enzyme related to lactoylglutathione lyase
MRAFDSQITFFSTRDLDLVRNFYAEVLGLQVAVDQGACLVFRVSDGAYLGFCTTTSAEFTKGALVTLVTDDVDGWASRLRLAGAACEKEPSPSPAFGIYNCFFRDPEGRMVEIQRFDDPGWDRSITPRE